MERPNAWKTYTESDLKLIEELAKKYRCFLDNGKTERECADEAVQAAYKVLDNHLKQKGL